MKIRKSFYIRWLLSVGEERQTERSVIDVEHIQSGDRQRVSTMEEASEWMRGTIEQRDNAQEIETKRLT